MKLSGSTASQASAVAAGAAAGGAGEADEEPLALGELAQLTVSNEPEAYDVASANKESFRKTWNAKYTLRSHFDGVSGSVRDLTISSYKQDRCKTFDVVEAKSRYMRLSRFFAPIIANVFYKS